MVEFACDGLAGVAASQVEMSSGLQFFDGIKSSEIQEILVKSASDLIDLEHPNSVSYTHLTLPTNREV